jgi:hypothetical protein
MSPAAFGSGAFGSTVAAVVVDGKVVDVVGASDEVRPADAPIGCGLELLHAARTTIKRASTPRRVTDGT